MNQNSNQNSSKKCSHQIGTIICKQFIIEKYLDAGHHGRVFQGFRLNDKELQEWQITANDTILKQIFLENLAQIKTLKDRVAIKIQDLKISNEQKYNTNTEFYNSQSENSENISQKQHRKIQNAIREKEILESLKGEFGFPKLLAFENNCEYQIMIFELMGQNLQSVFQQFKDRQQDFFSFDTILFIGLQLLDRIQILHEKGYIHRDIKPENILIGLDEMTSSYVYLIDFSISKKYITEKGHIKVVQQGLVGTRPYNSLNSEMGFSVSRRDDLQSLGYVLLYLYKGHLPWMYNNTTEQISIVDQKKVSHLEKVFYDINPEFWKYFRCIERMKFEQKPNYEFLKNVFRKILIQENYHKNFQNDLINYQFYKQQTCELPDPSQLTLGSVLSGSIFDPNRSLGITNQSSIFSSRSIKTNKTIRTNKSTQKHNSSFFQQQSKSNKTDQLLEGESSDYSDFVIANEQQQQKYRNSIVTDIIQFQIQPHQRTSDDYTVSFDENPNISQKIQNIDFDSLRKKVCKQRYQFISQSVQY